MAMVDLPGLLFAALLLVFLKNCFYTGRDFYPALFFSTPLKITILAIWHGRIFAAWLILLADRQRKFNFKKLNFMKRLFLMLIALSSVVLLNAQTTDTSHKDMKKDCIAMKDGKVLQMKDGNSTELTADVTLEDGTIVSKDGTVKTKDGKTVMLKEGDRVWMNGKISHKGMKKKDEKSSGG